MSADELMALKSLAKIVGAHIMARGRGLLAMALCLATCACISSTGPILGDANSILGQRGMIHLYEIEEDATANHRSHPFHWDGRRYVVRGRGAEISEFTAHPYEGRDLIVQARAQRPLRPYFYALARKLAEGVYVLTNIDANDADEGTRNRFCIKTRDAPCRIETPEQLFVFARASAARENEGGGKLAVLVRAKPKPKRR
jgi:hypothetical protein